MKVARFIRHNFVWLLGLLLLAFLLFRGIRIESVDEYYQKHLQDIRPGDPYVTLSIDCKTVFNNLADLDKAILAGEYLPPDGIILPTTKYALRPGDTVFDILQRATRDQKIQLEYQDPAANAFGTVYVQGINYLYEFSCGKLSGWMYKVNGVFAPVGCSQYVCQPFDRIEFVYTCNLGKDVGDNYAAKQNWFPQNYGPEGLFIFEPKLLRCCSAGRGVFITSLNFSEKRMFYAA